jgi:hypothetical protein
MKNIRLLVALVVIGFVSTAVVRAHDHAEKEKSKSAEKSCCAEKKDDQKSACCSKDEGKSCCEGEKAEPKK